MTNAMRHRHPRTKQIVRVVIDNNQANESSYKDEDYEKFNEQLDRLDETIGASEDLIESRTFEIAAGGLTVSLTILSLLRDTEYFPENGMILTCIIWGIFTLSILLHYYSQFASKRSSEKMSAIIHKKIQNREKYDCDELNKTQNQKIRIVKILNIITPFLLSIGIILLIGFTCYCFIRS